MPSVAIHREIDLVGLTIAEIRDGLASGRYSAEALAVASMARIRSLNGKFNAIIFENEAVIETARAIDRRRASRGKLGPLAGVPVVVKDTIDMAGFPTTAGWDMLYSGTGGIDLLPERDSPAVARLRAADALIMGKTNVPKLSLSGTHSNDSWAGPTLNGAAQDYAPGGSSAGTATAVATAMCVVGLGEETGGSIQNPASAQGLVGITPTTGLVPNAGVFPLSSNRDVVGPIARTVQDAATCLDVIAGFTMEDPKTLASIGKGPLGGYVASLGQSSVRGKRLGLFGPGWREDELSVETTSLYVAAIDKLRAAGATPVNDPFKGTDFAVHRKITPGARYFDGRGMESIAYDIDRYLGSLGPKAAIPGWSGLIELAGTSNPFAPGATLGYMRELPDFLEAIKTPESPPAMPEFVALKSTYFRLIEEVFARHRLDALVYPQMLSEVPKLFSGETIRETAVSELNIAGIPGITVPAGRYRSGAPFGLIFLGRQWSEADLLGIAFAFEQLAS